MTQYLINQRIMSYKALIGLIDNIIIAIHLDRSAGFGIFDDVGLFELFIVSLFPAENGLLSRVF